MTPNDEKIVRDLIKKAIDKEFKSQKEEISSLNKKVMTKDDVKDLFAKIFVKQNKFMWEKSKFINSYLKDI